MNLEHLIEDRYGAKWGSEFYPVGKSVTWLTGKALEALALANYNDDERLRRARDFLIYSQYEDGNWPDFRDMGQSDPLATGNILTGLKAAGVDSKKKVFKDARAALFQHLKDALENKSTDDMVDLTAVCPPETDKEQNVIIGGLELILESQEKNECQFKTNSDQIMAWAVSLIFLLCLRLSLRNRPMASFSLIL